MAKKKRAEPSQASQGRIPVEIDGNRVKIKSKDGVRAFKPLRLPGKPSGKFDWKAVRTAMIRVRDERLSHSGAAVGG